MIWFVFFFEWIVKVCILLVIMVKFLLCFFVWVDLIVVFNVSKLVCLVMVVMECIVLEICVYCLLSVEFVCVVVFNVLCSEFMVWFVLEIELCVVCEEFCVVEVLLLVRVVCLVDSCIVCVIFFDDVDIMVIFWLVFLLILNMLFVVSFILL